MDVEGQTATVLPRVTDAAGAAALEGRRVCLVGTYLPVPSLKKMPRPGREPEWVSLGQVVIEIEGRACDWDPAVAAGEPARISLGQSPRPEEEIRLFTGRRVSVSGLLRLHPPPTRSTPGAFPKPSPMLLEPASPSLEE
jgi:hypothetical protein